MISANIPSMMLHELPSKGGRSISESTGNFMTTKTCVCVNQGQEDAKCSVTMYCYSHTCDKTASYSIFTEHGHSLQQSQCPKWLIWFSSHLLLYFSLPVRPLSWEYSSLDAVCFANCRMQSRYCTSWCGHDWVT